jgi:serine/threonine protein kinase
MSDFENLSPSQINSLELPDWSNYGYHLLQRLEIDEEALKFTYLAREIEIERLVIIKEWWNLTEVECTECLPAIDRLKQLDYPNIPRYLNSFTTPTGFAIVREYQEGKSLAQLGTLPPADIQLVANAVLKILGYLQYLQPIVIHGNIKPENIIVDTQAPLRVYLVDFRLFPTANSPLKDQTPGFIPPEQLSNRPLSSASDLYSLGMCLICALTGTNTKTAPQLLDRDYRPQFKHLLPDNIHPQLIAWLEKMVEPNYQRRHLNAGGAREPIGKIPSEKRKGIAIIPAGAAGEWIPWGIGAGIAIAVVLLLRQFVFIPDPAEKSPLKLLESGQLPAKLNSRCPIEVN